MDVQDFPTEYFEGIVTKTFSGLQMSVRDTNLTPAQASWYVPGTIIRERGFTDATGRATGMVTSHRIAILSNHLHDITEGINDAEAQAWGLRVAQAGSRYKVLDVYHSGDKTQILLLHLPDDDDWRLFQSVVVSTEEELVATSRERFDNQRNAEVVPVLATERWLSRVAYPIGFKDDGTPQELEDAPTAEKFFGKDDYAWLSGLANLWEGEADSAMFDGNKELATTCVQLASYVLENDPACFEQELENNMARTQRFYQNPTFARLVLLGLEFGVACGDGACANYLGAMYYLGDVVEQNYVRAKELYEAAERKGVVQAMVNLGYIYEYGRTGEPDYQKAYMQYAKVAALVNHSEALYKLGDMYLRAKVVEHDPLMAYGLYNRSLEEAEGEPAQAQPAIRIAGLISTPRNQSWGIPYDPMGALMLYQLAERGLRVSIAQGETYYRKRLQEAVEGQEHMRKILDEEDL